MSTATPFATVRQQVEAHGLTLVRAHPRADRLHLDLTDAHGHRVVGQWFHDGGTAQEVARSTGAGAHGHVRLLDERLVLQTGGADRRLQGLAPLVAAGAEIVVHRPERRAVVRSTTGDGGGPVEQPAATAAAGSVTYTKVVRPRRTADLARRMTRAAAVPGVRAPHVIRVEEESGTIRMSTLPGTPLHEMLTTGVPTPAAREVGVAVRTLHRAGEVPGVPGHDLGAEVDVTRALLAMARLHGALGARLVAALERDAARAAAQVVAAGPVGARALLHRDLHDKQLLVAGHGEGTSVGMLDVDTLGTGDPALDLGNLLAHLDLRVRQGWVSVEVAAGVEDALLDGYGPDARTRAAAAGYRALTRARLRALYAFRPGDRRGETAPLVSRGSGR